MNLKFLLTAICLPVLFLSCREKLKPFHPSPAFYYWKTEFHLSETEKNYLDALGAGTLYVKFFDLDWDEATQSAIPLAKLQAIGVDTSPYCIVPTVFITNRTFEKIKATETGALAERVYRKLQEIFPSLHARCLREVQVDCDWTEGTRDRYFAFLKKLKVLCKKDGLSLSATIRLHQVKFKDRTGVPPVDKGMVMWYNTGDIDDFETENSILNARTTQQYLTGFQDYRMFLDVALPLFSWGLVFRDGKLVQIINSLKWTDLHNDPRFRELPDSRVLVLKNTYLEGNYLYKDDVLRMEGVDWADLEAALQQIRQVWQNPEPVISFYHLDSLTMEDFPAAGVKKLLK